MKAGAMLSLSASTDRRYVTLYNRTLVKVSASEHCISFRTVSRRRKSPRSFLVTRDELERLEHEDRIIVSDIHCFASLRRDISAGTLTIDFSWLTGDCDRLTGWEETVRLPYDALTAFVHDSAQEGGPEKWAALSLEQAARPQIVFADVEGLRKCLQNKTVRGKLSRALRDNFRYHSTEQVIFYRDFEAYSFFFRTFSKGQSTMCGGLIFHNFQNDLKKAYYSVHT